MHKLTLSILATIAATMWNWVLSPEIPVLNNNQIQTVTATSEVLESPTKLESFVDLDVLPQLNYAQKAELLRQQIIASVPEDTDPFVRKAMILYGPKIILTSIKNKHSSGERFAQLLLESSKVKNGKRVWSSLTEIHNNFGGVKASKKHKATPPLATEEVVRGKRAVYKLKFAKFDTKWDGLDRYLNVLSQKRYRKAMTLTGYSHFRALAKAGYCTEPADSYADKCMKLYRMYNLALMTKIQQEWATNSSSQHTLLAQSSR